MKPSPANHCFIASYRRIVKGGGEGKKRKTADARAARARWGDEVGYRCTLEKGFW